MQRATVVVKSILICKYRLPVVFRTCVVGRKSVYSERSRCVFKIKNKTNLLICVIFDLSLLQSLLAF